ncbi:hypothetical protein L2E82_44753 [Cichorium intybus]|uniref:Uncharacterized protein n=1 Tax=Cichorium intybus TaxID=13427 RepID=A0ACB8ZVI7_CICIN|nr:hypothetical protein L2E82_44753 [Cichorium intybus]
MAVRLKLHKFLDRKMNPSDIYSIIMKLAPRTERSKASREAFVAAKRFLHQPLKEFSLGDDQNGRMVIHLIPMLGIVYQGKSRKATNLFFHAEEIRRALSVMLESFVGAMKKTSHSDPEARKEMLLRMEWMLNVRKFWSYAWRQAILEKS